MAALRDELYMQMGSLHSRYDCVRKVMVRNPDLLKLPVKQAKGAIQKLWCDWTYSDLSSKEAQKVISRENARRMIDMSDMLRQDCMHAYQDGRLSVYMEDVVRRLERLQKNESEEEETSKWLTKRKHYPYAGNKHAAKGPAMHQHSRQGAIRNTSLQQASVHLSLIHI